MTNEEAHKYLENLQREFTRHRKAYAEELISANGIAILAIEKQIPKKPIIYNQLRRNRRGEQFLLDDYEADKCPMCGNDIISGITYRANYCSNCGQRLDWSE